ncbi:stage V sporulation protein B [Anaeromicrobium sediminis]|uniref:Stage V sporulation protein B n=1 Tax=Anaeromicrobium sediminis TaxID=1478221 RepID=A0A267MI41_9FIRM|nr:stage V sporulation protein B [Anaeromicrobium sediminis]PAB59196.1 stage V sporulation protein B [Anaeromicrobium sediminis]
MKKNSFLYGTLLLVVVNFIVRFLGFFYKVVLSRMIGAEGVGLFHLVFPVLMICITFTTAGLPVAVSKLVAHHMSLGNKKSSYRVLALATITGVIISTFFAFLLFKNARFISDKLLKSPDSYYSLLGICPSIVLITLSSIFRGYYYGIKEMKPAGTSQVLEQLFRITFVIGTLYLLGPVETKYAALVAVIGISVGELTGFIWLVYNFKKTTRLRRNYSPLMNRPLFYIGDMLIIATPITITRLIAVLMQSLNALLIPQKLQLAGYSYVEAMKVFGKITGMAFPLLFLPFIVTSALVINIIPNVSQEMAYKNLDNIRLKSGLAMKMTLFVSIPLFALFLTFSEPICTVIYNEHDVSFYLSFLSYTVILWSLHHTAAGVLHGMGKQVVTTINYLIGISFQLFCTFYLVPNPRYGIKGFLYGFLISSVIICTLNVISLKFFIKKMSIKFINDILKPIICTCLMITCVKFAYSNLQMGLVLNTTISILFGFLVYMASILITGSVKISTLKYVFTKK